MTEQVAKSICHAAGTSVLPVCPTCDVTDSGKRVCSMWPQFMNEAEAAIVTAYRWHKAHHRWPSFVKGRG